MDLQSDISLLDYRSLVLYNPSNYLDNVRLAQLL